jgi:hypothetical protein
MLVSYSCPPPAFPFPAPLPPPHACTQLGKDNHLVNILTCLNPVGTVPAGGYAFVDFVFQPREVKEYATDISICIKGGKSMRLRLTGQGLRAAEALQGMQVAKALDTVPARQLHPAEGQIAKLSLVRGMSFADGHD